jgi:hypothetical protein
MASSVDYVRCCSAATCGQKGELSPNNVAPTAKLYVDQEALVSIPSSGICLTDSAKAVSSMPGEGPSCDTKWSRLYDLGFRG